MTSKENYKCPEPNCYYDGRSDNLKRHLQNEHQYDKDEIVRVTNSIKAKKAKEKGRLLNICIICNHACATRDGIVKHVKKCHPDSCDADVLKNTKLDDYQHVDVLSSGKLNPKEKAETVKTRMKCPFDGCDEFESSRINLCQHFNKTHQSGTDHFILEQKAFDSQEQFEIWYSARKEATCSTFVKTKTSSDESFTVSYFQCSCEGEYHTKATKKLGHSTIKTTGSRYCTAFMKVEIQEKSGKIHVCACFSHYGHLLNPSRQKFTEGQVEIIKKMLDEGFYNDQAVKKLRKEHGKNSRLHYVTVDDLRILRARFNMFPGRYHQNDLSSVDLRFMKNDPQDGIRYFQKPINATGEGFRMIIITPRQLEVLQEYSDRAVVLDDTHNTTQYSLKLTTIMVVTGKDRGFPCGFMISNTTTTGDVEYLFREIKKLHPNFSPRFLMTDEANVFYNAYLAVFPHNKDVTMRLLCRWHIFRAWKKYATSCLQGNYLEGVLGKLNTMLRTPSKRELNEGMNELLEFLRLTDTAGAQKFSEYFRVNYYKKLETWSTAFRDGTPLHTSMFCESWHSILKVEFLMNKKSIRVDHLIYCLYEAIQSISDRREIEESRDLAKANPRKAVQREKHRLAMNEVNYYKISQISDGEFRVSKNGYEREYVVRDKKRCDCDSKGNCHCNYCNVCSYRFSCSCHDQTAGVSCKHQHMILIQFPSYLEDVEAPIEESDDGSFIDIDGISDIDERAGGIDENDVPRDLDHIPEITTDELGEDEKQKIKDECSSKLTSIQNLNALNEKVLRNLLKNPTPEVQHLFDEVLESYIKIREVLKTNEKDALPTLPLRTDVLQSRTSKRLTAREVMNDFKMEPKKKKLDVPKQFHPSFSYENDEIMICDICKAVNSPYGQSSENGEIWRNCFSCRVPAHASCLEHRRDESCGNCHSLIF